MEALLILDVISYTLRIMHEGIFLSFENEKKIFVLIFFIENFPARAIKGRIFNENIELHKNVYIHPLS